MFSPNQTSIPARKTLRSNKALILICSLLALLCMGCPMEIEIECNGKTVAAIVEIQFKAEKDQNIRGKKGAGAYMEVAIKPKPGSNLQECCPQGGQLVWRQWFRSNREYLSFSSNRFIEANKWYADLHGTNPNLDTEPLTDAQAKEGYVQRYIDRPAQNLPKPGTDDKEWEAVTAFGTLKNGKFTPLAAFTWGYSIDSDGDVDLDGPSSLSLSGLKDMNLPSK